MDDTAIRALEALNLDMARAEMRGDKAWFDELLAPTFAFRRANGAFEDRQTFLAGLKPGANRLCEPASLRVVPLDAQRAFVTCIVRVARRGEQPTAGDAAYHNARLFVQDADGAWRLLAWANEPSRSR